MSKIGRNDSCPCNSGKKFKQCCMRHTGVPASDRHATEVAVARDIQAAVAHHQAGRLAQAEAIYRKVLVSVPGQPDALHLLGLIAHRTGRHELAVELIEKAIGAHPSSPVLYNNLGTVFQDQGRLDEAIASFRRAFALKPDYAEAYSNLANVLDLQGKSDDAIANYRKALSFNPDFAAAHFGLANALRKKGEFDEALACYRQALALRPDYAEAHSNLGLVLEDMGKLDEALASYRAALAHRPDLAEAYGNIGNALQKIGRIEEAAAAYSQALKFKPDFAEAHGALGNVLQQQGKTNEAIAAYRQALALNPESAEMNFVLASALQRQEVLDEAAALYRRVIELDPGSAEAYGNLALVLQQQGKLGEAIEGFLQALVRKPDFAEAYNNMGFPLQHQGRLDEALASYRRALAIRPDYAEAHSNLLLAMQYARCGPDEKFAEHLRFGAQFEAPHKASWPSHQNTREPHRRLRVGYVSGDFRDHAVAYFIEPILANHDKGGFEVFCYYNHFRPDGVSTRIEARADHWIPCWGQSDDQLAERIRGDGIDILIDLAGHTAYNRLPVFARKPAPVQMTWIGYPATTGLAAMDYRLTEESLDPTGMTERYHTETLLRLPSGATFLPAPESPPVNPLPALTSPQFTLANLNGIVKLNQDVVRLWSRILTALPNAVLMLGNVTEPATRQRLLDMFECAGISADRLMILPRMPIGDYLEAHHHIDLALDPFPYNGGTTTCHSLWMGVPVVTLAGNDTASRYGVALMQGLGLTEFIAASEDEYAERVSEFARDLPRLDRIRQSLRERITANQERDPVRLTRHLENAYRMAWKRWCDACGE